MTLAHRAWRAMRAYLRARSNRATRLPIPPECWPLH
jgi:hypothetical protein